MYLRFAFEDGAETLEYMAQSMRRKLHLVGVKIGLKGVTTRTLSIPRTCLEIVTIRPDEWSVVERPYDAVDLPVSWGSRYAVCPRCRPRSARVEHPAEMQCGGCRGVYPVRWPRGLQGW